MDALNKILGGKQILGFMLFKKRSPVAVRINLTNRCVNQCSYCRVWDTSNAEMTTQEVCNLLDVFSGMGTRRISFSGGEPMMRDDVGEIISYCKDAGLSPSMNTSGHSFIERIDELRDINLVKFSLDGKKDCHDPIRGNGSYDLVTSAAEAAHRAGIKFSFSSTITSKSATVANARFMLGLAERYGTTVAFQPLKKMHGSTADLIPISPFPSQYKRFISFLLDMKQSRRWKKHLRTSQQGLRHIENWPDYGDLKCQAGNLFLIVQPNGDVVPCDRMDQPYAGLVPNYLREGMEASFDNLPQVRCAGCGFCGALELNFLCSGGAALAREVKRIISL